jgi:hypothetical protein
MAFVACKSPQVIFNYKITFGRGSFSRRQEVIAWCAKHFGDEMLFIDDGLDWKWNPRWKQEELWGYSTMYFRDSKDFMFFILSWGDLDYDCQQ